MRIVLICYFNVCDAVRFAKVLSNKLIKSEELDEDKSQELLSDDTDEIDPLIVGEEIDKIQLSSQGAKHSVEKVFRNMAILPFNFFVSGSK